MKKILTLSFLLSLLAFAASAADSYSDYYRNMPVEVRQVKPFTLPARSTDVRDFGATGDGVTLDTRAIQKAIDEIARVGGGHVIVPQGVWRHRPA